GEQEIEGRGLGDDAAAGGDDDALMALDHRLERAALIAAKGGLAIEVEDRGKPGAGLALDLAVEFDEGHVEALGERVAERRFAGAAQPDERDAVAPLARHRGAEGIGEEAARLRQVLLRKTAQRLDEEREFHRP